MWLGDEDRGLAWFVESQRNWSNAPDSVVQRIVKVGNAIELQIHIINFPIGISAPLRFSFGLQATPVKPRPANARGWRLGSLGQGELANKPGMGNIQIIWPNENLAYYGYPQPENPSRFKKLVADLHARGVRVVPYINLNFLSTGAPEWNYYNAEFHDPARSFNSGDVGQMGHSLVGACPRNASWRDLIAYKIARFVEEYKVDGIYVDCWNLYPCYVESHGCGWRDAEGELRPNFPIRAYREVMRRAREVLSERAPNVHIIAHMSTNMCMPYLSFADSMLDGEQYQVPTLSGPDYLAAAPLDKWRTENTGIQWGVFPFFLPEFRDEQLNDPIAAERLMGLLLAHDASPWPIWCNPEPMNAAWKAMDKFGATGAKFSPYWKPNGISSDNKEIIVSAYNRPGSAMLVVVNTSKQDTTAKLRIDAAKLGLQSQFSASGGIDGKPLGVTGQTVQVTVPARNHRLIVLR